MHGYAQLATWDVLVKSSNIGMSMLGERMGNEKIWTGADQLRLRPAHRHRTARRRAAAGVNPLKQWTKYSTESCAQGYELMVTPLQLAARLLRLRQRRAAGAAAHHQGRSRRRRRAGHRTGSRRISTCFPQVIDPTTAADSAANPVRRRRPRHRHEGPQQRLEHLRQDRHRPHLRGPGKGYSETLFNSSFIAGAPRKTRGWWSRSSFTNPHADTHYGGAVAAPGATKLLERCMAYLQVPASPDLPLPPANIVKVLYEFRPQLIRIGRRRCASDPL